jgi:hypothetical protein
VQVAAAAALDAVGAATGFIKHNNHWLYFAAASISTPCGSVLQVPSGLLPVLEIDGRVVTESATIMALLEEQFPGHKPLMPAADSPQRPRADQLMRLERRFFSDWLNWLCR